MSDVDELYSAGWVSCDRIADCITEAKTALDAIWPRKGEPPNRRDVEYLLDSVRHMLYKRAQPTRNGAPPAPPKPKPQTGATPSMDELEELREEMWGSRARPRSESSADDSRAEYQGYRSRLRERE